MSELVLLHHNEPMTTSLAIAEGTQNTHQAIMKMVRTYVGQLQEFGEIGFEIRLNPHGKPTELAFLNEPQATLLITFLRNSEIVVKFKVALVKAFYELRDSARISSPSSMPRPVMSTVPGHAADLVVAADRTFRALKRSALAMGMEEAAANRYAREGASRVTGSDVVSLLGISEGAMMSSSEGLRKFMKTVFNPDPYREEDGSVDWWTAYHNAYRNWCNREGIPSVEFEVFQDSAYMIPERLSGSADPIPFEPGARRHLVK